MAYANPPEIVTFGVYPVALYDMDPVNSSFNISFYAWWRTKDKNYKPETSIEIVNSRDYTSKLGEKGKNGNEYYTYVHYYAKIHHVWDSKNFPFGHQYLDVKFEDFSDASLILFDPDYEKSSLHSELVLPGWKIVGFNLQKSITEYTTNFGDTNSPNSKYSRITFSIEIKRNGWRLYMSYFIGFFMAGVLAHLLYITRILHKL